MKLVIITAIQEFEAEIKKQLKMAEVTTFIHIAVTNVEQTNLKY